MDYTNYKRLARRALGEEPASLVLRNARVINVFSEEIIEADIAVEDGMIVGVGDYTGPHEVDLGGRYVCPGFIDAHLHLESTLATPRELICAALRHGTTTFIVDPHEATNVAGEKGIDYILDQTDDLPANVFVMLPSCVPVNEDEENGCDLTAEKMRPYLQHPRIMGLGEVMDYVSVTQGEPAMLEKLALFADRVKDGHAPGLTEKQLAAYALAKIKTDHEGVEYDYAMRQIRNGMYVLIREGSGAKNLEAIVGGIVADGTDTGRFAFCTDDKHIGDIEAEGHISHNVRKSIALGLPPLKAIKMATLNPAVCYRLDELGAVAPGYRADLLVLDDLESVRIHAVYSGGKPVTELIAAAGKPCPPELLHSVHIAAVLPAHIQLPMADPLTDVIGVVERQIITRHLREPVPVADGLFQPNQEYNKVVVVERHRATGHIGVAPAKGFCIGGGAIASTMSHDSHNLVAVGDSDAAILAAVEELNRVQGGYTVIAEGRPPLTLPLPVMGLMSQERNSEIEQILRALYQQAHALGVPEQLDPFVALSFICLPVIPSLRITTKGLYDVETQGHLPG